MEPHAAVTVIVGPQPAVLLIRRPVRATDPWSGQWALPGGRRQTSDATLLDTARRELAEEVGLHLSQNDSENDSENDWTALPTQVAGRHAGLSVLVAPYLCHLAHIPELRADAREVAATYWLPLPFLDDPSHHHLGAVPGGGELEWPHFYVDGHPLWGFTYRVLTSWRLTLRA